MEFIFKEIIFWIGFISLNSIHYLINYIFEFKKTAFLPFFREFKETRKLGLLGSTNHDIFRYTVEFSLLILLSRLFDFTSYSWEITAVYFVIFFFNTYQYGFRKIYNSEPNFYSDSKLLRQGLAIIWHESKWRIVSGFLLCGAVISVFHFILNSFLYFSYSIQVNTTYYTVSTLWLLTLLWAVYKIGLYSNYPNDIHRRYHFTLVEIFENLKRSITNYLISKTRIGQQFREARSKIHFHLKGNPPNLHFIFIESYGSYLYKDESLKKSSLDLYAAFTEKIAKHDWSTISGFSQSPTTGGQSWLTYSSMIFGLKMSDNTHFENYFNDPDFILSNSLMRILKNAGYTNYNLNPIKPITGIHVPYEKMRTFYGIDRWILSDNMAYHGDVYGFGECPPDQFSMNYTMELINKEKASPYTFFYLTKNSHSPFIPPTLIDNWKDLNHPNGSVHVHKGFLKYPTNEDYLKAITYQLENLGRFINDHGKDNDIFLLIGDHQPPMLSNPEQHGTDTPVHVISKNSRFLDAFKEYNFTTDLKDCKTNTKHEALFSIFLRSFMSQYGEGYGELPNHEPDGLQL